MTVSKVRAFIRSTKSVLLLGCAFTLGACQSDQTGRARAQVTALPEGVTVFAAGDIADCRHREPAQSDAAKTAALIAPALATDRNAVVLTLGDSTYPAGRLDEFTDCYDPTWGRFKQRTYPAPGNHEYYTPRASGYYTYFGRAAGPEQRGYYSFNVGTWHLISLNSNLEGERQQAQLSWLKNDLEQNNVRCTLAYWHHPLYSSGGHGSNMRMKAAWDLLQGAGAELVLSGHDHDYERFAAQDSNGQRDDDRGMRQFVIGTGGTGLTLFRFRKWNSERSQNLSHGVIKLELKDGGYEWQFIPVDQGGFTDRGAGLCH